MIVWKGAGIAVVFFLGAAMLLASAAQAYMPAYLAFLLSFSFIAGGIHFFHKWLEGRSPPRTLVDPNTGETVTLVSEHTFMFISIKWWAYIVLAIGLFIAYSEFTDPGSFKLESRGKAPKSIQTPAK